MTHALSPAASHTLARWHEHVEHGEPSTLPEILAQDCVFLSPVVHTPQVGRDISVLYLTGAMRVFGSSFRYTKEVETAPYAILEFESTVDDVLINGVDIITFNDDGLISEFRVMVRPLKGMQMLHAKMGEMLDTLKKSG